MIGTFEAHDPKKADDKAAEAETEQTESGAFPEHTIDEPVIVTIKRDLHNIKTKLMIVVNPM